MDLFVFTANSFFYCCTWIIFVSHHSDSMFMPLLEKYKFLVQYYNKISDTVHSSRVSFPYFLSSRYFRIDSSQPVDLFKFSNAFFYFLYIFCLWGLIYSFFPSSSSGFMHFLRFHSIQYTISLFYLRLKWQSTIYTLHCLISSPCKSYLSNPYSFQSIHFLDFIFYQFIVGFYLEFSEL